ncbi:hypothetical protein RB195_005157 [Necator americanus]|uniref:Uncharacterized protein n=1 Tax=Necator americanus TaxID=51031 RepID=A0ABR1BPQ0_NECAM
MLWHQKILESSRFNQYLTPNSRQRPSAFASILELLAYPGSDICRGSLFSVLCIYNNRTDVHQINSQKQGRGKKQEYYKYVQFLVTFQAVQKVWECLKRCIRRRLGQGTGGLANLCEPRRLDVVHAAGPEMESSVLLSEGVTGAITDVLFHLVAKSLSSFKEDRDQNHHKGMVLSRSQVDVTFGW